MKSVQLFTSFAFHSKKFYAKYNTISEPLTTKINDVFYDLKYVFKFVFFRIRKKECAVIENDNVPEECAWAEMKSK